jgi:hypothetical protein
MSSPKKRKPNISLISVRKSYEVREVARLLDRSTYTVRSWIKEGLPLLAGSKPRLIDGAELKTWLQAKWSKRKKPCAINQLHCCKCRDPRAPDPASIRTEPRTAMTTLIRGKCHVCGTAMQQFRQTETLAAAIAAMMALKQAPHSIAGYLAPSDNTPLFPGQGAFDFNPPDGGSKHVH